MAAPPLERFEAATAAAVRRLGLSRVCSPERAVTLAEFGLVGLTGAAVNFAIFMATVGRVPYLEAGTLAFSVAICWTFALNWAVTFGRPEGGLLGQFARYVGVCAVGYVIYAATLVASVQVFALPYWLSSLGAITGGGLWNYLGSEQFALA